MSLSPIDQALDEGLRLLLEPQDCADNAVKMRAEIATLRAERDAARADAADCRNRHAIAMRERDAEAAEEDRLRVELDGAQQQLRAVIKIKEEQATTIDRLHRENGAVDREIVTLREECTRLYRVEAYLTRRVKWAMARIQDLLLGGDL